MFELIKLSLWNDFDITNREISQEDYDEMERQTLIALPASVLSKLSLQPDLRAKWKESIFQQVVFNANYKHFQANLPFTTPYVILKGTAAAQYYPYPEYRTMGDIDIMTRREDYICACETLLNNDWQENTSDSDQERGRHRSFVKEGFVVEIHAFFASMNDPEKARYLDDMIVNNINDSHILPDMINGLVLIDHVNQHMEEGLGLRQIIDWMMFVDKCLPDEKWPEFDAIVMKTGLETLAITTTRMCEMYLGLHSHKWCEKADERLCHQLMNYIVSCGNFGIKRDQNEKLAISRTSRLRHPGRMLSELQRMGVDNWEGAQNPLLKHFAWVWQGIRFLKGTPRILRGYYLSKSLNQMFNKLGVKRDENGLVYYIDGEYIKK